MNAHLEGAGQAAAPATPETELELFFLADHSGLVCEVNEEFARLLGFTPVGLDGRSLLELVHPADIPQIVAGLYALEGGAAEVLLESRFMARDGGSMHLQWVARPQPGTDRWRAAGRDTTEFHRLLGQSTDTRARLELAIGPSSAAMWELDLRAGRFTWEPQAAEVLGLVAEDVPKTVEALATAVHPDDVPALRAALRQLTDVGSFDVGLRVGRGDSMRYVSLRCKVLDHGRRDRPLRAVGLVLDVTPQKATEKQMLRLVMSDGLTGVPNRRSFDQTLRNESRRCTRGLEPLSIVMVDIDHFKSFNDSFGHLAGDAALIAVARALTCSVQRASDTVARFGGEEFAVVLPGVDEVGALAVGARMIDAMRTVTVLQAPGRTLTISIGTASWDPTEPNVEPAELLRCADQALYAAKAAGRDCVVAYRVPGVPARS
jgi:diguanylate cyclase (GGDEF)-like protein/PAS domain S-box-containing protein